MFPEANHCMKMLFAGIFEATFNVTNQFLRQLIAMNVTMIHLTTGVELSCLLADKSSDYTRPGLRWGDVLFLFWDIQPFPSGRRSLRLTLSIRVYGQQRCSIDHS